MIERPCVVTSEFQRVPPKRTMTSKQPNIRKGVIVWATPRWVVVTSGEHEGQGRILLRGPAQKSDPKRGRAKISNPRMGRFQQNNPKKRRRHHLGDPEILSK
eukprot:3712230-Pleurochrysis_carterae.AAC.1